MANLRRHFYLFVYGTLRSGAGAAAMMRGCERVASGEVGGILYEIDGEYPALILYGSTVVQGEVWRCPTSLLPVLDEYEGIEKGLFRRVAVQVPSSDSHGGLPCWIYVAGPLLSHKLVSARRIAHWPS